MQSSQVAKNEPTVGQARPFTVVQVMKAPLLNHMPSVPSHFFLLRDVLAAQLPRPGRFEGGLGGRGLGRGFGRGQRPPPCPFEPVSFSSSEPEGRGRFFGGQGLPMGFCGLLGQPPGFGLHFPPPCPLPPVVSFSSDSLPLPPLCGGLPGRWGRFGGPFTAPLQALWHSCSLPKLFPFCGQSPYIKFTHCDSSLL